MYRIGPVVIVLSLGGYFLFKLGVDLSHLLLAVQWDVPGYIYQLVFNRVDRQFVCRLLVVGHVRVACKSDDGGPTIRGAGFMLRVATCYVTWGDTWCGCRVAETRASPTGFSCSVCLVLDLVGFKK